jgi:hypothetical protein
LHRRRGNGSDVGHARNRFINDGLPHCAVIIKKSAPVLQDFHCFLLISASGDAQQFERSGLFVLATDTSQASSATEIPHKFFLRTFLLETVKIDTCTNGFDGLALPMPKRPAWLIPALDARSLKIYR